MNLIIPYRKFELQSNLSAEEVIHRMAANIEPPKSYLSSLFIRGNKFHGILQDEHFRIIRDGMYNVGFPIVITGKITSSNFGSVIGIRVSPPKLLLVLPLIFFYVALHQCQTSDCQQLIMDIICPILIIVLVVSSIFFTFESIVAKRFICNIISE
jgi:hypothetical protein